MGRREWRLGGWVGRDFGKSLHLHAAIGEHAGLNMRTSVKWQSEAREIRTPNLLIWSQTRYRCAIAPVIAWFHPQWLAAPWETLDVW